MDPDAMWKMLCESLQDLQKNPDNRDTRTHVGPNIAGVSHLLHMAFLPGLCGSFYQTRLVNPAM
jgi:hypothetical protein